MSRKSLVAAVAGSFVALVVAIAPLQARAGGKMDIDKRIATAKTAADHEAIAAYFDTQAAAAKAEAEAHAAMRAAYEKAGGALIGKLHLDQHCDKIEASYEDVAKENAALAEAHRAMAKELPH
jgi:hypothetical protein